MSNQPVSPRLRYASNGVLLRSKQPHSTNVLESSSKDMEKKFKRFSLDQHQQQISESNIYRSSMAMVPNHDSNVYPIQHQTREEFNIEIQRSKVIVIVE
jgi:hypothetical protein